MINLKECYAHEISCTDVVCVMGELWKVETIEEADIGFNFRLDSLDGKKSTWMYFLTNTLVKAIVDEEIK